MRTGTAHIAIFIACCFFLTVGVIPASASDGLTSQVIGGAIARGMSAEMVALLLLLPLVATLVSVMHYVLGISGYGIFMPTMMAVVMTSTGVAGGLLLFAGILAISLLSNLGLKKLKLHFWPARSMGLMLISVVVFGLVVASSYLQVLDIRDMSIYPVLFMILLAEEFTRTQLAKSKKEAVSLTIGTLILAILGAVILKNVEVQKIVLDFPEVTILLVMVINILVGNYKGIRLTEIKRFKGAIRKKWITEIVNIFFLVLTAMWDTLTLRSKKRHWQLLIQLLHSHNYARRVEATVQKNTLTMFL